MNENDIDEYNCDYIDNCDIERIKTWKFEDNFHNLMAYVKELWKYADDGYWEEKVENGERIYTLHTAGWSGNEDIIQAMVENIIFWTMHWESSYRGGHYEFRIFDESAK